MFQHQDPVSDREGQGAPTSSFADNNYHNRGCQPPHDQQTLGNGLRLAPLLRPYTRIGPRGVYQGDQGFPEFLGQSHQPVGLAVTLGLRHAEISFDPLPYILALLVSDDHHRAFTEFAHPTHNCGILTERAVSMKFNKSTRLNSSHGYISYA